MKHALPLTLLATLALGACTARVQPRPRPQPSQSQGQAEGQESVWVCHGNRNPRWQRVAAPAADAHRRHGDRVSTTPRTAGDACTND